MPHDKLPKEIISLIQHQELHKAGWRDKAVENLIITTVWLAGEPKTTDEIFPELMSVFPITIDKRKFEERIEALCEAGKLVSIDGDRLKIGESALGEFEESMAETEELENKVKARFVGLLTNTDLDQDPEETWENFREKFLCPLIQETGARTYELFFGRAVRVVDTESIEAFLGKYPLETRELLKEVILIFLDPKDRFVRSYIFRNLNAYFLLEAAGLEENVLDSLMERLDTKPIFNIFVDTNFLFSILGIHDNPSNEAAESIIELTDQISERVDIKLFVLPPTLNEAKKVLIAKEANLRDVRINRSFAVAGMAGGVTGITQKFLEQAMKSRYSLNAEAYFRPYIESLPQLIRSKRVEIYGEKVEKYRKDQRVVDDILSQLKYEKDRFGERGKGYEQLEHDITLWHFVKDHRPKHSGYSFEARYWVITIDYRFLGYDQFKRRRTNYDIPICVHPTALIQMLQFWVPRSPKLEEAILGSIRLPFLLEEFEPQAELTTIRILQNLSRFSDIKDLPKENISAILLDQTLRGKIKYEENAEKQISFVRDALIKQYEKEITSLKENSEKADHLETVVINKDEEIESLKKNLDNKLKSLEKHLNEMLLLTEKEIIRVFSRNYIWGPLIAITIISALSSYMIAKLVIDVVPLWRPVSLFVCILASLTIPWVMLIVERGKNKSPIESWRPYQIIKKLRKRFLAVGILIFDGIIASLITGLLGKIFRFQ